MASTVNRYFTHGTGSEQNLVEDLIIESLKIYGKEFFYIPRTMVSKDNILGEDRLSKFLNVYPIEMYFDNVDNFDGQGAFIQKFGLMMEQSATLTVARKRWNQLIASDEKTNLPNRPSEGDLIYFPLTKGLFEIKFVQHQDPFYQIGKLYVYKLQVELFQYSSERIETGINEVDMFEDLKTFDTDMNPDIDRVESYGDNNSFLEQAGEVIFSESNPFGDVINIVSSYRADSATLFADSSIVTSDRV